jgi:iduronate 2-sulfatase
MKPLPTPPPLLPSITLNPTRRKALSRWTALFLSLPLATTALAAGDAARPNILFIAIDDLRNDLGALGVQHAQTPHLDALAGEGRLFSRHYVQVPSCGPSRAALLSGQHPTSPERLPNNAILQTHPQWGKHSIPAWLREHGYRTLALGKITHHPGGLTGPNWAKGPEELPGAWDRSWVPADTPWKTPQALMHGYAGGKPRSPGQSPPIEMGVGDDHLYPDAWIADEAIKTLGKLADEQQPWFFAVGFFKPHLPFAAPKQYFDRHDPASIPDPPHPQQPEEPSSWHPSREMMMAYGHGGRDPRKDDAYARELRHAYAAATTYVDAQIGRLLEAFRESGLDQNTILIIWSDHGFCLGEHNTWGKHSLYEESLAAPLIIWIPELPRPGDPSSAVVETVDLFPTLCDLVGIEPPPGLHGHSLRPQLLDPDQSSAKPAFGHHTGGRITVRTEDWRLIGHQGHGGIEPMELFDFRRSPVSGERVSVDKHLDITRELLQRLGQLPPVK